MCWLLHRWSKWAEPVTFEIKAIWAKEWSHALMQRRECSRCGKVEMRRVAG